MKRHVWWSGKVTLLMLILGLFLISVSLISCCGDDDDDDDDTGGDDDTADDDDTDDDDDDERDALLGREPDIVKPLDGLSGIARVAKDQYTIPYIFAETPEDLMLVLGYTEAIERFYQMDFFRTVATGRLSEWLGSGGLDSDIYYRTIFMAKDGNSVVDNIVDDMDQDLKDLAQKFSDGINLWLAERREAGVDADWPPDYSFPLLDLRPDDIPDWTVRDTIAYVRLQTYDLSGTIFDEIGETQAIAALPTDLYNLAFSKKPATDTTILPVTKNGHSGIDLKIDHAAFRKRFIDPATGKFRHQEAYDRIKAAQEYVTIADPLGASNNWIVEPALGGGTGFLANDPHLTLNTPNFWLLMLMDTSVLGDDTLRTWGAVFAGTNLVAIGANKSMAWGETVCGYDVQDVYQEHLILEKGVPDKVHFNGGEVDLIESEQEFILGHGVSPTTVTKTFYVVPHHGPLMYEASYSEYALSHRWTGADTTHEAKAFAMLNRATSVDEGFTALNNFEVGGQNFVMQDVNGDLGYYPHANVPLRTGNLAGNPPWLILPGDGSIEWDGIIANGDLPQAKNPAKGWLATANNDIDGSLQDGNPLNDANYLHADRAVGYRAQRVHEVLDELSATKAPATFAGMKDLQHDVRLNYAADIIAASVDALGGDMTGLTADSLAILGLWDTWNYVADTGLTDSDPTSTPSSDQTELDNAVSAMAFAQYEARLKEVVMDDEFTPYGIDPTGSATFSATLKRLMDGTSTSPLAVTIFNNINTVPTETKRDCVVAALNAATADLRDTLFAGLEVADWLWGRKHHLYMENPFPGIAYLDPTFNLGPYAIPGGLYTVNVANYAGDGEDFIVGHGPSLRSLHELENGVVSTYMTIPGGISGYKGNEHQTDLLDLYLAHDYVNIPTEVVDILEVTEVMIEYTP